MGTEVALVTGGTDGIGKEVARGLAGAGHEVVLVGRDPEKGARAVQELRRTTSSNGVRFLQADLALMSEAERVSAEVASQGFRLRYLVHSAGIVRGRRELTAEGIESNFAVNYLSRFVLTTRLLPLLEASGRSRRPARVVLISGAARHGTIHFDDVNLTDDFTTLRAVWQFCQANDVITIELARRLAAASVPGVTITCLKVGVVKTNIRRGFPLWMRWIVPLLADPLLGQTPQAAAQPALRLLLAPEFSATTGALFLKVRSFRRAATPQDVEDPETGRRLWTLSERLAHGGQGLEAHTP